MNFNRIKGMLVQEYFITVRSYEVILDIFVFPIMSILLFGFLALYLTSTSNKEVAYSLLMGMLLWQVIFIIQYSVSVGSLWNIWSRNLSNIFITPISLTEYMFSQALSGITKAIVVFVISSILANFLFGFNILVIGVISLLLYGLNLIIFAISLGMIILGLIFRFGTRIQAFAWGLLPIFQPLTAAFYPLSVLPQFLQIPALLLPPTYVFEALRANMNNPGVIQWNYIGLSFIENVFYFIFAIIFLNLMLDKSKISGQFARLES